MTLLLDILKIEAQNVQTTKVRAAKERLASDSAYSTPSLANFRFFFLRLATFCPETTPRGDQNAEQDGWWWDWGSTSKGGGNIFLDVCFHETSCLIRGGLCLDLRVSVVQPVAFYQIVPRCLRWFQRFLQAMTSQKMKPLPPSWRGSSMWSLKRRTSFDILLTMSLVGQPTHSWSRKNLRMMRTNPESAPGPRPPCWKRLRTDPAWQSFSHDCSWKDSDDDEQNAGKVSKKKQKALLSLITLGRHSGT